MKHKAIIGSRNLFPELKPRVYLAHSAVSPLSLPVKQKMFHTMSLYAQEGVGVLPVILEEREQLRALLASLIHTSPKEIALTHNTSAGIIAVAQSLPWKHGEEILLFDGEFPSNVTPWQQAAHEYKLKIIMHPRPNTVDQVLERVEQELKQGVRLLALSAVQFQSGFRMPLEEIGLLCKQYGCLFFVDAIQACGAMPINVDTQNIDFLSSGGHKWLMAPEGTGFLYIRQEHLPIFKHRLMSWLSHQDGLSFLFEGSGRLRYDRPFKQEASMFEMGVSNVVGYSGMYTALNILLDLGIEHIYAHTQNYLKNIETAMTDMGFVSMRRSKAHSQILSFQPPEKYNITDLVTHYAQHKIILTGPDGLLRIAPHWPNNHLDEHDYFMQVTKTITSV